jgi:hypothetical protein
MKAILTLFSLFLFAISFTGCSKNDPSINATRLRIKLTDAPVLLISEFNVDIQKIEISTTDNTTSDEKWTTLDFQGGVYNVLPLSNGKSKQIIDQFFPAGVLRKIKITFGNNSKIKTDTGEKDLILDSEIKDGIIVEVNENLYANYITSIMIDINAALSFYESNGNYFLKPVLRIFPEAFGGSLKGYVLPVEAMPIVKIVKDKDTLFTIPEKSDGMFLFKGLKAGEWEIAVLSASSLGYRDTLFVDSVFAGKTRELKSKIILKK